MSITSLATIPLVYYALLGEGVLLNALAPNTPVDKGFLSIDDLTVGIAENMVAGYVWVGGRVPPTEWNVTSMQLPAPGVKPLPDPGPQFLIAEQSNGAPAWMFDDDPQLMVSNYSAYPNGMVAASVDLIPSNDTVYFGLLIACDVNDKYDRYAVSRKEWVGTGLLQTPDNCIDFDLQVYTGTAPPVSRRSPRPRSRAQDFRLSS